MSVRDPLPWSAFFLAGDSYPRDSAVEDALAARLLPHLGGWTGQAALKGDQFTRDRRARAALLEAALPAGPALSAVVLIGRSSGARVATMVATRRPVGAVVCLGYPFRRPGAPPEPGRVAHLPGLTVPTLILQGVGDAYGTPESARALALPASIRVEGLATDHNLNLDDAAWDAACRLILDFLAATPALTVS